MAIDIFRRECQGGAPALVGQRSPTTVIRTKCAELTCSSGATGRSVAFNDARGMAGRLGPAQPLECSMSAMRRRKRAIARDTLEAKLAHAWNTVELLELVQVPLH